MLASRVSIALVAHYGTGKRLGGHSPINWPFGPLSAVRFQLVPYSISKLSATLALQK